MVGPPGLAIPTLVLGGDADRLIDFSHQSEWLSKRLANAELVPIQGAGHMVHHTAQAAVADAIGRFAGRPEVAAPA